MNQNTLLAIILSIFVLFSYEAIFVAPKRAQMLKNSQTIVNKEFTEKTSAPSPVSPKEESKTTNTTINQALWEIKTPELKINLSNMGGSLHNMKLITGLELPLADLLTIKGFESAEFHLITQEPNKAVYTYEDNAWRIIKTFVTQDDYTMKVRMEIIPLASQIGNKKTEAFEFNILRMDASRLESNQQRENGLDEYSIYVDKKIVRKGNAFKFSPKEDKSQFGQINWVGFRNHYSAVVIHPEFKTKGFAIQSLTENKLNISVTSLTEDAPSKGSFIYDFSLYAGPQDMHLMKKYGKEFEKIVAFSNFWLLDGIAKAIHFTIPFIHSIVRSWGMSIILISVFIYGLTYPLTMKSMLSMKKMQKVQPKIKALQERYKNEPQKLNAEIMDIYKREKINPLGGCLPFLLQMPIFISLYQVLWRSYYFQGHGFLWIKDLTQPDRLFILPFSLPFLGNELNILPLLMAGVMFLQQRLSSKNMVVSDETQAMQQKMMMYFFPFFIGFIFYKFASGLSLYFTVFYALSTLSQWKMSKTA